MKKNLEGKKLKKFIILGFVVLFLIIFVFGITEKYASTKNLLVGNVQENFGELTLIKGLQINDFLKLEKQKVQIFKTNPLFQKLLMNEGDENYNQTIEEVKNRIEDLNSEIIILDKNGILIISQSNPAGEDYSYFVLEEEFDIKIFIYYNYFKEEYFIAIFSSVFDGERKIGFIGFEIPLSDLNEVLSYGDFFQGEIEAYVINDENLLITPIKGLIGGIFAQKIDTLNSKNCFESDILEVKKYPPFEYLDYRGETVLGTFYYFEETNWCLIVEIKKEKILDKIGLDFFRNYLIVFLLWGVLLIAIGYFIANFLEFKYFNHSLKKKEKLNILFWMGIFILYYVGILWGVHNFEQSKLFDSIPDFIYLFLILCLINFSKKVKNSGSKFFLGMGGKILLTGILMELFLQEYQVIKGVLSLDFWIPSMILTFGGLLLIFFGYLGGVKNAR